jgi:phosphate-selective porin
MTAGRVVAGLWDDGDSSAEVAFNGFHYDPKVAGTPGRVAWGVDGAVTIGKFTTEAEYLKSEYDYATSADRDADGWWIASIWTPNPVWQGVVRYGSSDPDNGVSDDDSRLWTFGVNYRISGDDLKLSLNYLVGEDPDGHGDRLLSRLQVKF